MAQQPKGKSDVKLKLGVFTLHHAPTLNSDSVLIVSRATAESLHRQLGELLGTCSRARLDCESSYPYETCDHCLKPLDRSKP